MNECTCTPQVFVRQHQDEDGVWVATPTGPTYFELVR